MIQESKKPVTEEMDEFDPNRLPSIPERMISLENYLTTAKMTHEAKEKIEEEAKWMRERLELPAMNGFPEIMTGIAGQWANTYGSYLESPPQFFYMSFLTCLGLVLAGKLTLNSEIKPEPRFYIVLLGESALTRKSTAIDLTVEFFKDNMTQWADCRGVGSAEGLQERLKNDKTLLLVIDELKAFVGKCKIEGSILLPCITTLFESNRYEAQTKRHKVSLDDIHLGLLGACTTETYETMWSGPFLDIGLINRLFLVPGSAQRRFSFPDVIPQEEKEYFAKALQSILSFADVKNVYELTPDAKELFDLWYMSLENSVHSRRLDTYALRLMPLLAVNEFKEEVDVEIVEKVIDLMNWQLEMRRELDPVSADTLVGSMEEKIRRILMNGDRTDRELRQLTNANRAGLWVFTMAKRNLRQAEEITYDRKRKCFHLIEKA